MEKKTPEQLKRINDAIQAMRAVDNEGKKQVVNLIETLLDQKLTSETPVVELKLGDICEINGYRYMVISPVAVAKCLLNENVNKNPSKYYFLVNHAGCVTWCEKDYVKIKFIMNLRDVASLNNANNAIKQ